MKLEEGEVICPKCGGGGSYPKKFAKLEDPYYSRCPKCWGDGKLDWIELCVGKQKAAFIWGQMAIPKIRTKYPKLIAKELAFVQPIDWTTKKENTKCQEIQ